MIYKGLTFVFWISVISFVTLYQMINDIMKLITVKRETQTEKRFTPKMGELLTKVTYIKKQFLSIPFKTVHKYRETYYGEVKDCEACELAR